MKKFDKAVVEDDVEFPYIAPEAVCQLSELCGNLRREREIVSSLLVFLKSTRMLKTVYKQSIGKCVACVAQRVPKRLEEFALSRMHTFRHDAFFINAACIDRFVKLVNLCRDKENKVVDVILSLCNSNDVDAVEGAVHHPVKLARERHLVRRG